MVASDPTRFNFSSGHMLTASLKNGNPGSMLRQLKKILKQIARHVKN
jgi:hypothetical protein